MQERSTQERHKNRPDSNNNNFSKYFRNGHNMGSFKRKQPYGNRGFNCDATAKSQASDTRLAASKSVIVA